MKEFSTLAQVDVGLRLEHPEKGVTIFGTKLVLEKAGLKNQLEESAITLIHLPNLHFRQRHFRNLIFFIVALVSLRWQNGD